MSSPSIATLQADALVAPYQAALTLSSSSAPWHSHLTHQGHVLLAQPELHLGQMEANDLVLSDPAASRYHAVIRWTPQGYTIEDLGSTSGTYVNGQRVQGTVLLAPGQHIRIGTTELVLHALEGHQHAPGVHPAHRLEAAAATLAAIPAHVFDARALHRDEALLGRWLRLQFRKRYWRVFLVGLLAYLIALWVVNRSASIYGIPLPVFLASLLVPVTFVLFCWEEGAFVDMPPVTLGLAFASGAVLGALLAWLSENVLLNGDGFGPSLVVALCEETAKAVAVIWFLRSRRLRSELDGLVLGAAAGMGFAALETAGYGLGQFFLSYNNYSDPNALSLTATSSGTAQFAAGATDMMNVLTQRMELAFFGHGVWTAILIAAIWRERTRVSGHILQRLSGVLLAFALVVALHTLWDGLYSLNDVSIGSLVVLGGDSNLPQFVLGLIGLFILRFFIVESVERAKLGPAGTRVAASLPSLARALGDYILHPIQGRPRHPAAPQPYPVAYAALTGEGGNDGMGVSSTVTAVAEEPTAPPSTSAPSSGAVPGSGEP